MKHDESPYCPFCKHRVIFDKCRDINLCDTCGAHETSKGWQKRDVKAKMPAPARAKNQLDLFLAEEET